jgi:hypothetical protein
MQAKSPNDERSGDRQRRTQNFLLAANAAATFVQAHQTAKLAGAVGQLQQEVSRQAGIFERIASDQSELLDEARKQTQLLELSSSREMLERAAQNAVFELKVQVESIKGLRSNLEKYIMSSSCLSSIKNSNIKFEDLPSISDKEHLFRAENELIALSTEAMNGFSEDENKDLNSILSLQQRIRSLGEVMRNLRAAKSSIEAISNRPSAVILKEGRFSSAPGPKVTLSTAARFFFFGVIMVVLPEIFDFDSPILVSLGLLSALSGSLGLIWCFVRAIFSALGGTTSSDKRLNGQVEDVRKSLISDVKSKFEGNAKSKLKSTFEPILFDTFEGVARTEVAKVKDGLSAIFERYPSLSFEVESTHFHESVGPSSVAPGSFRKLDESINIYIQTSLLKWSQDGMRSAFIVEARDNVDVFLQGCLVGDNLYMELNGWNGDDLVDLGWYEKTDYGVCQYLRLEAIPDGCLAELILSTFERCDSPLTRANAKIEFIL